MPFGNFAGVIILALFIPTLITKILALFVPFIQKLLTIHIGVNVRRWKPLYDAKYRN